MRLRNAAGQSFELQLVGYSPHSRRWLVVSGQASDGGREWDFEEPCLKATEVRALGRWLVAMAHGRTKKRLDFTEPLLAFEMVGPWERVAAQDAPIEIRVSFELEARPPWHDPSLPNDDTRPYGFTFALQPSDLLRWRASLLKRLESLESNP